MWWWIFFIHVCAGAHVPTHMIFFFNPPKLSLEYYSQGDENYSGIKWNFLLSPLRMLKWILYFSHCCCRPNSKYSPYVFAIFGGSDYYSAKCLLHKCDCVFADAKGRLSDMQILILNEYSVCERGWIESHLFICRLDTAILM